MVHGKGMVMNLIELISQRDLEDYREIWVSQASA